MIFRRRIVHKEVFFGDQRSLFTSCYAVCINLANLDYVDCVMRSCHLAILRKQFSVVEDFFYRQRVSICRPEKIWNFVMTEII